MRRSLALMALIAVPLAACASGGGTPTATQPSVSAATSPGAQATDAMPSSSGVAMATSPQSTMSESMMSHPESAMMTEESIAKSSGAEEPQVVGVRITTADSEF